MRAAPASDVLCIPEPLVSQFTKFARENAIDSTAKRNLIGNATWNASFQHWKGKLPTHCAGQGDCLSVRPAMICGSLAWGFSGCIGTAWTR